MNYYLFIHHRLVFIAISCAGYVLGDALASDDSCCSLDDDCSSLDNNYSSVGVIRQRLIAGRTGSVASAWDPRLVSTNSCVSISGIDMRRFGMEQHRPRCRSRKVARRAPHWCPCCGTSYSMISLALQRQKA